MQNNHVLIQELAVIEKELSEWKLRYKKALDDGKEFQEVRTILDMIRSLERQLLKASEGKS